MADCNPLHLTRPSLSDTDLCSPCRPLLFFLLHFVKSFIDPLAHTTFQGRCDFGSSLIPCFSTSLGVVICVCGFPYKVPFKCDDKLNTNFIIVLRNADTTLFSAILARF